MPAIIIDITPDGETTVEAQGYRGVHCLDATRAIERALGETTKDSKKPEFTQSPIAAAKKARQQ